MPAVVQHDCRWPLGYRWLLGYTRQRRSGLSVQQQAIQQREIALWK